VSAGFAPGALHYSSIFLRHPLFSSIPNAPVPTRRSSASPWQREAIDRIKPVAKKLASNTTAAIEHLNKNPLRINEPQYQQHLKSNAEAASNLAALVKDLVEYGKTRTTLEAYERKLEVPK